MILNVIEHVLPAPGAREHVNELSLIHVAWLHELSPIEADTNLLSPPKLLPNTVIVSRPPSDPATGSVNLLSAVPRRGAEYENRKCCLANFGWGSPPGGSPTNTLRDSPKPGNTRHVMLLSATQVTAWHLELPTSTTALSVCCPSAKGFIARGKALTPAQRSVMVASPRGGTCSGKTADTSICGIRTNAVTVARSLFCEPSALLTPSWRPA